MLVENWAVKRLEAITDGFDEKDIKQMVGYALTLPEVEMKDYFESILGSSPDCLQFLADLIEKRKPKVLQGAWKSSARDPLVFLKERLEEFTDDERVAMVQQAKLMAKEDMQSYFTSLLGDDESTRRFLLQFQGMVERERTQTANQNHQKNPSGSKKKEKKKKEVLVNLEKIGKHPPRDGRDICDCQAAVHDLVTNCLECGKIICSFEGTESCPWCGSPIRFLERKEGLDVALARKDTLLEFDRNSAERTHVTDVATDFDVGADQFNKWLTPEQRALALKQQKELERLKEEQKSKRVITLDLENNRVFLERPMESKLAKADVKIPTEHVGHFRNPTLSKPAPKFIPIVKQKKPKPKAEKDALCLSRLRDELQFFSPIDKSINEYEPDCRFVR
jgi:rubrerythrin